MARSFIPLDGTGLGAHAPQMPCVPQTILTRSALVGCAAEDHAQLGHGRLRPALRGDGSLAERWRDASVLSSRDRASTGSCPHRPAGSVRAPLPDPHSCPVRAASPPPLVARAKGATRGRDGLRSRWQASPRCTAWAHSRLCSACPGATTHRPRKALTRALDASA